MTMQQFSVWLHAFPMLCLFLSIVLGHIIGRFHVRGVGFGAVVGTLIAAISIGIVAKPEIPELMRWAFFYLFLFSIGYGIGPQFFGSLKKAALPQIALAVIVAIAGLAAVIAVTAVFSFDEGLAVGLLSGGMTQSAALGTGLNAISELSITAESKATLMANAPLADAVTYLFGDLGLILFLTWLGPKIMRADLKSEARELERKLSGGKTDTQVWSGVQYSFRAYRIENASVTGSTLAALEERYVEARMSVQRVQRGNEVLKLDPNLGLKHGDLIALSARRMVFAKLEHDLGPEIDDPVLLSVPVKSVAIVVTEREVIGKTIGKLALDLRLRGVYLESLQRGTELMPHEAWTVVERGDILRIVGSEDAVERAASYAGFVERDLSRTDLTFLAGGICAGILLGLLKVGTGFVILGLGTSGSILLIGLVAGWLRSRYPVFGAIPDSAQRLLMDIGLIVFIAAVGLQAGPHAVDAYNRSGGAYFARIFVAGMIVTTVPLAVGAILARFVLKMTPLMILGGLAGAQTCTPGLNALREASDSNVGSLAYTVPYAIGNILLTVGGPVVVAIVHAMRQ